MDSSVLSAEPDFKAVKTYIVALQGIKDGYTMAWNVWLNWLNHGEQKPDYENYKLYMEYLIENNTKGRTINAYRSMCIQRLLSIFAEHNYADRDLIAAYEGMLKSVRGVKIQRSPISLIKILSVEEIKHLMNRSPLKVQLMVEVMYYTACRVSELANMKWSDFGLPQKIIDRKSSYWLRDFRIIGKGKKERSMNFPDALHKRLRKHRQGDVYVFTSRLGGKYSASGIQKILKRYGLKVLDRRVTPHMLRHSRATHLVQAGADPRALADFLGHSSAKITMENYTHTSLSSSQLALAWREKWI